MRVRGSCVGQAVAIRSASARRRTAGFQHQGLNARRGELSPQPVDLEVAGAAYSRLGVERHVSDGSRIEEAAVQRAGVKPFRPGRTPDKHAFTLPVVNLSLTDASEGKISPCV